MAGNNVDEFKEKLDLFLQSIPDEPNVEGYVPSVCEPIQNFGTLRQALLTFFSNNPPKYHI
jgi:hypothetical protein